MVRLSGNRFVKIMKGERTQAPYGRFFSLTLPAVQRSPALRSAVLVVDSAAGQLLPYRLGC